MNNSAIITPGPCRKILSYLYPADVCNFEKTSKGCKLAVESEQVWEEFIDKKTPSPYFDAKLKAKDNFIQRPLSRVGKFFFLYGVIELLSEQFKDQTTKEAIKDLQNFQKEIIAESIKPYLVMHLCMYNLNKYVKLTELILLQKLTINEVSPLTKEERQRIEKLYSNIDIEHISLEKALTLDQVSINKLIIFRDFINKKNITVDEVFLLNQRQSEILKLAGRLIANNVITASYALSLSMPDIINLLSQF